MAEEVETGREHHVSQAGKSWKMKRLIIAQSTKALSDPQRGENHRETQKLALSSRQWQDFKGFLKARAPHFYSLQLEGEKKGGQSECFQQREMMTCIHMHRVRHMY